MPSRNGLDEIRNLLNVQNSQTFVLDGRQTSVEIEVNGISLKTGLPRETEQPEHFMAPSIPRRLKGIREQ